MVEHHGVEWNPKESKECSEEVGSHGLRAQLEGDSSPALHMATPVFPRLRIHPFPAHPTQLPGFHFRCGEWAARSPLPSRLPFSCPVPCKAVGLRYF